MDAQIGITLSKLDTSLLKEKKGTVSEVVRDMIANCDRDQVINYLKTDRTTVRINLDLAAKIQEIADELETPPGRVARAMIELELYGLH